MKWLEQREIPIRKPISLTEFYNIISRRTDTSGTQINVAETKRVLSEMFILLDELGTSEALAVIARGVQKANSKKKG